MRALLSLLTIAFAGCVVASPAPTRPAPTAQGASAAAPAPGATAPSAAPLQLAAPAQSGPLTLEAHPRFGQVLMTDGGAELDVLVRLKANGAVPTDRAPVDLAIVLDRSGSMRGDKIVAVKAAALKLLDQLKAEDRVTVISYSDTVTVDAIGGPMGPSGRALRDALIAVTATGSTALGPALFQAIERLEASDRGEGRMAHVMLLSDGLANVGEQRPQAIGQRTAQGFRNGVSVSTLGVGLDYAEDLMTRVADQGGGRYHFIKDSDSVAAVLSDEMAGLVATVARGVELDVTGAQVIKAFGYPLQSVDGVSSVRVGAMGAGQTREVVLRVRVPAGSTGRVDLGQLNVRFRDATQAGAPGSARLAFTVNTTTDPAAAKASEDIEVAVRVSEVESAEKMEQVAIAASSGDFAAAGSQLQVAVDDLKRELRRAPKSAKLQAQLADFEEAQAEMKDARRSDSARRGYSKKFKSKAYQTKKR